MKTPKKVIEKISLPLMFVTFVMAVLMFAVSPVSAAPNCDSDGDEYFKNSGKWCDIDTTEELFDPDDSDPCNPNPEADTCDVVSSGGSITYTAELTGAFVFSPDPIVEVFPNSKESALLGDPDTPDNMAMPTENGTLLDTWDAVFDTCPVLLGAPSLVNGFEADDWYISKYGGVRVMFRDFLLPYDHETGLIEDGAVITVQLVGNYFDSDLENFLPVPVTDPFGGPDTASRDFVLTDFVIWGETAHGVPRPRRACQPPGDGGGGGERDALLSPSLLVITATRVIP